MVAPSSLYLEVMRVPWIKSSFAIAVTHELHLRRLAWRCDAFCPAVLIDMRFPYKGSYWVACCQCVFEAFDDNGCYAFASPITVRSLIKSIRFTVGRKETTSTLSFSRRSSNLSNNAYPADPIVLKVSGLSITFEPPTIDMSLSLVRSDWTAWCSATKVVEQAVSIVMLAPRKSKK